MVHAVKLAHKHEDLDGVALGLETAMMMEKWMLEGSLVRRAP